MTRRPEHSSLPLPAGRTKILLVAGFTLSLLICVVIVGLGLSVIYLNQSHVNSIVESDIAKAKLQHAMHSAARERSLLLHMMLDTRDPFDRDELFLEFNRQGADFARARLQLLQMALSPAEQDLIQQQGRASGVAVPVQRRIVDLIQQGRLGAAQRLLLGEAVPLQNQVLRHLATLEAYQDASARDTARRSTEDIDSLLLRTVVFLALGVIVAIAIAIIVIRQITRTEKQLQLEKRLAQVTLHSIGEAVITTDCDGHIEYLNPVAESLTGWHLHQARGRTLLEVLHIFEEGAGRSEDNPVRKAISEDSIICSAQNLKLRSANDLTFAVEHTAAPIRDEDGHIHGGILIFRDVTEVRTLSSQLTYQASHDALTGLVNRREFEMRLQHALESARAEHREHAVCYIDLDQFKVINDTCGHAAGDELLKQIANEFKAVLRDNDTLARLGGDEFGILLEGCSLDKAIDIADKLRNTARALRFSWDNKQFEVGASLGVVPVSSISGNLADVLSAADAACYEAKDQGRNRYHVYDPNDIHILRREGEMHWVHRINDALESDKFLLFGQPIRASSPGVESGHCYEVLLRMRGDDNSLIPPTAFLPAAERYNLMSVVDRYVVEQVMGMLERATHDGPPLRLTVNISGQSLSEENFLQFVDDCFARFSFSPSRLTFEITETAAVSHFSRASEFISRMKDKGCMFALDDFGSGLSSFAYLKNIPVDFIKIDGSFVRDIVDDATDRAFVASMHQIASIMGLETIAEYVENENIAARLRTIGVDYLQGMYIGEPLAMEVVMRGLSPAVNYLNSAS